MKVTIILGFEIVLRLLLNLFLNVNHEC
jgi:hypothetical protein